ncbi:uncharacterized protein SAPINGB_P000169 [Magnusiomyces paraingens]|uniref:EKC/KEOPS complex subunit GON7 n=1 Tax=Magnusiomyces paraingens TaxID=2606893 RepID=A0A5E8AYR0_9ASCO|nr:uncharacterized protein SAPINGB_P000169 [Saprochaete ingens]VVT43834.1 unnamed protein product [Saprochaete ingens]
MSQPIAIYSAPEVMSVTLTPEPIEQLRKMNQLTEGEEDRDAASVPEAGTRLGDLRRQIVSLQRATNAFLTDRMREHQEEERGEEGKEEDEEDDNDE